MLLSAAVLLVTPSRLLGRADLFDRQHDLLADRRRASAETASAVLRWRSRSGVPLYDRICVRPPLLPSRRSREILQRSRLRPVCTVNEASGTVEQLR